MFGLLARRRRYAPLVRACTPGDGVIRLDVTEAERLALSYDERASELSLCKFVPASGAASRMFKVPAAHLATIDKEGEGAEVPEPVAGLVAAIDRFAFSEDLKAAAAGIPELADASQVRRVLTALLDSRGLDYASLPKALIKFHRYGATGRASIEEHLFEAAHMARGAGGVCRLHFTLSPEHSDSVRALLARSIPEFEKRFGVRYATEFSVQKPSTDSPAVAPDGTPFRDENGRLLFRPAGHGALIENLAEIDSDVVFIKNIDNVVPESAAAPTLLWKRALAGLLLELQAEAFAHVDELACGVSDPSAARRATRPAVEFLRARLGVDVETVSSDLSDPGVVTGLLARPLRVCGVVPNTGEPGGGPFWVRGADGRTAAQIVETSEIDPADAGQQQTLGTATHFNPVDIVCAPRGRDGTLFDLTRFVDRDAVFIVEKYYHDGRPLRSVELPGLWNGSMAGWNTVFVEVPIETFNPVKEINDLLRAAHQ